MSLHRCSFGQGVALAVMQRTTIVLLAGGLAWAQMASQLVLRPRAVWHGAVIHQGQSEHLESTGFV